jgi:hypothetical protein
LSLEAYVDLPGTVSRPAATELLERLGFVRISMAPFWHLRGGFQAFKWEEQNDYRSYTGTYAELAEQDGHLVAYVRTQVSAGYWDVAKQNECLRALRKRLGGSFESDVGKNRYFRLPDGPPTPAEAGCCLAFRQFDGNMGRTIWYLSNRSFPENFKIGWDAQLLGAATLGSYQTTSFCPTLSRRWRTISNLPSWRFFAIPAGRR